MSASSAMLRAGSNIAPPIGGANLLFPDSPVIIDSFASPELRGAERKLSTIDYSLYQCAVKPNISGEPSLEIIVKLLQEEEGLEESHQSRAALVLRHALQWGVERGDDDLVGWLAGLTGRWASVLDSEVSKLEDEEGWGLIGMAVQASCGRQDKEEIVRLAVARWGMDCGPRSGRDRTGWTPLHLSALISTPPLISFLLTRGASPSNTTNRGLTPLDLVAGMPERQHISSLLEQASNQGTSTSALLPTRPGLTEGRQKLLRRRRERVEKASTREERQERTAQRDREREKWIRERVDLVGVDPDILFDTSNISKGSRDSGIDVSADPDEDPSEGENGYSENDAVEELVFSPSSLPGIYDMLITSYQPVCQPLSRRGLPANMLFLYARFALRRCNESWLEELLEGAVDRIEAGVYGNIEDLAYLAFWAYNTTLLLYLLVSDEDLRTACDDLGLLGMVEELINAIHVFVIRVAERRIDQVLDGAILEYETLEDFDDVRFEGEWALFRTFGTKKQRATILPKATQVISEVVNAATAEHGSPSSIFNSLRGKGTFKVPESPSRSDSSLFPPESPQSMLPPLLPSSLGPAKPTESPTQVTDILTGVLVVLHLYEVNPAITIQAFSQVFFWIAAELFNRILARRKLLCRSKAIQIRMNITVLDDWVRLHGLPAKTAGHHFEPVLQLLQWLQTQSSIQAFDDLIGTVQGLKRLNPMQMRRSVRDYKFEVNEGRMDEECVSYMGQIQKDWESRRVQSGVKVLKGETGEEIGIPGTSIDALFSGTTGMADYIPSSGPECFGELLDSRFMLPFQLPDDPAFLIATPVKDAIFANFAISSPFLSDSRPPSRSSYASSKPFEFVIPTRKVYSGLPEGFFEWIKTQEAGRRHSQSKKRVSVKMTTVNPALGPNKRISIADPPSQSLVKSPDPITSPTPSSHLPSTDEFGQQSQFKSVDSPSQQNSYELKLRQAVNAVIYEPKSILQNSPTPSILNQSRQSSIQSSQGRSISIPPSPIPQRQSISIPPPSMPIRQPTVPPSPVRPPRPSRNSAIMGADEPHPYSDVSRPSISPSVSMRTTSALSPSASISSPTSEKKKWWKIGRKEGSEEEVGLKKKTSSGFLNGKRSSVVSP